MPRLPDLIITVRLYGEESDIVESAAKHDATVHKWAKRVLLAEAEKSQTLPITTVRDLLLEAGVSAQEADRMLEEVTHV